MAIIKDNKEINTSDIIRCVEKTSEMQIVKEIVKLCDESSDLSVKTGLRYDFIGNEFCVFIYIEIHRLGKILYLPKSDDDYEGGCLCTSSCIVRINKNKHFNFDVLQDEDFIRELRLIKSKIIEFYTF